MSFAPIIGAYIHRQTRSLWRSKSDSGAFDKTPTARGQNSLAVAASSIPPVFRPADATIRQVSRVKQQPKADAGLNPFARRPANDVMDTASDRFGLPPVGCGSFSGGE